MQNELTKKTGGLAENEECRMKNEESLLDNEKFTIEKIEDNLSKHII